MLLTIPEVLNSDELAQAKEFLAKADWVDGRVTAGHQSARAKNNQQIPENHKVAKKLGEMILSALGKNALFISAALPAKVFPPLFNRYQGGQSFGTHIDNAIRQIPQTAHYIRTDLSATLFLNHPEDYEGGELVIEDNYGVHKVKLPAGHMILYPASSLHHVTQVTKGARIASFFWIQSMVRDDGKRTTLFDLDLAIQQLNKDIPEHKTIIQLTGIYHNLLRSWADV
ncbi:MAG: Fe2+-dependent dioxygenase [Acidobacteria bacterium]|nr:Fe2+-dependent dioxygenase [Acidobacteriota bacterium]